MATKTATAPATAAKPKTKIDFSGTPGELIAMPTITLVFGRKMGRGSPYDSLLEQLETAHDSWLGGGKKEAEPMLRFGDVKARPSIYSRATKLQMRVQFAEHEGKLYVKYTGHPLDSTKGKEKLRAGIKVATSTGTQTIIELTRYVRDHGSPEADAGIIGPILTQMAREGILTEHSTAGSVEKRYSLKRQ